MKRKLEHLQNYREVTIMIYRSGTGNREFCVGNKTLASIKEAKSFIDAQYIPHFPDDGGEA